MAIVLANCSKRSSRQIIFENNVIVDLDRLHLFKSITITITIMEPRNRIQLQLRLHKNGVIDYKLRITIIIEHISGFVLQSDNRLRVRGLGLKS